MLQKLHSDPGVARAMAAGFSEEEAKKVVEIAVCAAAIAVPLDFDVLIQAIVRSSKSYQCMVDAITQKDSEVWHAYSAALHN